MKLKYEIPFYCKGKDDEIINYANSLIEEYKNEDKPILKINNRLKEQIKEYNELAMKVWDKGFFTYGEDNSTGNDIYT